MTNATQEQQKTAAELFNTGDENTIRSLTKRLNCILNNKENDYWFYHEETKHLTLQEFQSNFEWDESYSVEAEWETEILNNYDQELGCSSKEEALAYVRGEKELEEPDLSDYYPEYGLTGHQSCSLVIEVKNLRLKPQQPKQKNWKLVMEVVTPADIEEVEIDKFLGQCASLAYFAQVVGTDFNEYTENWDLVS